MMTDSAPAQLRWLREAGFDATDCLFKDHRFAVLVARRAGDCQDR